MGRARQVHKRAMDLPRQRPTLRGGRVQVQENFVQTIKKCERISGHEALSDLLPHPEGHGLQARPRPQAPQPSCSCLLLACSLPVA